jgi:hypothetical protein
LVVVARMEGRRDQCVLAPVRPPPAAAQSCDPVYVSQCVPPVSEVGDLNCDNFCAQDIRNIVLADPYNDPHGLDG